MFIIMFNCIHFPFILHVPSIVHEFTIHFPCVSKPHSFGPFWMALRLGMPASHAEPLRPGIAIPACCCLRFSQSNYIIINWNDMKLVQIQTRHWLKNCSYSKTISLFHKFSRFFEGSVVANPEASPNRTLRSIGIPLERRRGERFWKLPIQPLIILNTNWD